MTRSLLAHVTEPGDIVLYGLMLVCTVAVGLALFGIDALVGRVRERRPRSRRPAEWAEPQPKR